MIASPDCSSEIMKRALVHSLACVDAAAELDVDLDETQRQSLAAEKPGLESHLAAVTAAEQALAAHDQTQTFRLQARVTLGDAVLDRGVRTEKARMKLELRTSGVPDGADFVFGSDVGALTGAPLRQEPRQVLEALARYDQVPDYDKKADGRTDLQGRADRQESELTARDAATVARAGLRSALVRAVADASDALWTLDKRLQELFPRRRRYVRSYFYQVRQGRAATPHADSPASPSPATPDHD